MKQIAQIEKSLMKDNIIAFKAGDTVKVHVKIREGDKERVQVFQGTVIGRRGSGINATFTVRKMSAGIGVERVFSLHSPSVSKIERIRPGKVHRAKLFYLRDLTGKSARISEQLEEKAENGEVAAPVEEVKPKTKKAKTPKVKAKSKAETKAKAKAETKTEAAAEKAPTEEKSE